MLLRGEIRAVSEKAAIATPLKENVLRILERHGYELQAQLKVLTVMAHDHMDIIESDASETTKDISRSALWCLIAQFGDGAPR